MDVKIFEDKFALGKAAAALGAEKIRAAIAKKGSANVILATGAEHKHQAQKPETMTI